MVVLLGASGSGKSTLLKHLIGAVVADSGSVSIHGQVVQQAGRLAKDIRAVRRQIGYVYQQFNLVPRLPVIVNVMIGLLHRVPLWRSIIRRFNAEETRLALDAMQTVGMAQFAWQRSSSLSGGQQQRAALARCLVQGARIIVADEPIASLDPESARKVLELFVTLNRDYGCTIIVSLHQVELARKYFPRTIALQTGAVVYDGPTSEFTQAAQDGIYGSPASATVGDPRSIHGEPAGALSPMWARAGGVA